MRAEFLASEGVSSSGSSLLSPEFQERLALV